MTVLYEDIGGSIYNGGHTSFVPTGKDGEESKYCARSAKLEGKVLGICSSATHQSYKITKMVLTYYSLFYLELH